MSIGCVAIAGRPQDVVSSSGALWGHQTAETARGREWCIRYRITRLRNSVLSIANAPTGESSVLLCSPVRSVSTSGTVEIEASVTENVIDSQLSPNLMADVYGPGLPRFLNVDPITVDLNDGAWIHEVRPPFPSSRFSDDLIDVDLRRAHRELSLQGSF